MKSFTLNNGLELPAIGFGTYKTSAEIIFRAISAGYKYFDTASFYGTEACIAQAIEQSGEPRENFLIASKLWKTQMGYENVKLAFEETLENLKTHYLDVYMIHWPRPDLDNPDWKALDLETWRAMEEIYFAGKIRALGFSNFLPYHAENIIKNSRVMPAVAQLEFHPGHTQTFALNYFREKKILLQAWSPIARGRVVEDVLIKELAEKYRVSPSKICLRFCLQEGVMPLPKASNFERMRENLNCFDFELEPEDLSRLENMPPVGWGGEHPDRVRI